jgi:DNA-binding MarR family transcriptional regulator
VKIEFTESACESVSGRTLSAAEQAVLSAIRDHDRHTAAWIQLYTLLEYRAVDRALQSLRRAGLIRWARPLGRSTDPKHWRVCA